MIRAAYLRVYSPSRHTEARLPAVGPWGRNVVRADGHFMWAESDTDDVFTVDWKGERLICPRNGRLRMLEGILAFSNANPGASLLPAAAVQRAADELARLKAGSTKSHILTSPWHVPLRWFSAFEPEQRDIYDVGAEVSVRYRTDLTEAIERVTRAVSVIDGAGFDSSIVEQVEDLERWLRGFPNGSMLELDYATVAELFSAVELAFDDSVQQVQESLDALDELDYETAGERYATVASRWAYAQALSYVN
ncbi:MAG: hypothetical protein HKN91_06640 [Acidimicrobiia bacterium]|nr:hypothetical protein [Acidimicrobiia bacterium]